MIEISVGVKTPFLPRSARIAALDIASGFVSGKCYKRHRAAAFPDFLKQIDAQVPPDFDVENCGLRAL
jgi:hypothetical protein